MRIYVIDKDYQATEIDVADAAARFMAWLADGGSPVLAEVIQTWLWQPSETGGLGALVDSESDVAALRAEIIAFIQRMRSCPPDGQEAR